MTTYDLTPAGFRKALDDGMSQRNYEGMGPAKGLATEAGVSPTVVGQMLREEFPKKPRENLSQANVRKAQDGALFSLTRVCDTLDLDVGVWLKVFDLPENRRVIERSRHWRAKPKFLETETGTHTLVIGEAELDMLKGQIGILGPIPGGLALELVRVFRAKSDIR